MNATSSEKIKVLIADDHQVIIDGLEAIISSVDRLSFAGGALNGHQVIEKVEDSPVDVVLMDINMPGMDGLDCTSYLHQHHPNIRVIALSMHDNPRLAKRMIKNGAFGFLLKNANKEKILNAIYEVHEGKNYFDPSLMSSFMETNPKQSASNFEKKELLTQRELEIVKLICLEKTNGEIAEALAISTHTVESHRSNIFLKLEVKNVVGMVKWAIKNEVVDF